MKYFTRKEFACKCGCGFDEIDPYLVAILDAIREYFNRPCIVNSGCRCEAHNRAIRGAFKSQHILGKAADVRLKGIPPQLVAELAIQLGAKGIKVYDTFTHIDYRDGNAWYDKTVVS